MMIKVSVILTTYNSEENLQQTLDSIFKQKENGKDFIIELIVVDDCSTDNTLKILHKNHIDFITNNRNSGGPNKGRNIGLEKASGDYICFIDHDDTWHSHKILLQLEAAKISPIVSTLFQTIDISNNQTLNHLNESGEIIRYTNNRTFFQLLSKSKERQNAYLSTLMISKTLKHIRFEEHFGMIDYDWLLRLFEGQSSVEISKHLVTRHVNGSNLSLNKEYRKKDYYYSLMFLENYEDSYPKEVMLAKKRINGTRARYYYLIGEMYSARKYFTRSLWDIKTALYYLTSFYGYSFVLKRFKIFG